MFECSVVIVIDVDIEIEMESEWIDECKLMMYDIIVCDV